jgi:hypothetical protein
LELHFDAQVSSIASNIQANWKVNFQNPVDDLLNLYWESSESEAITVEIYTINGLQVYSEKLGRTKTNHVEIPMQNLAKGMYILRIKGQTSQESYSAKILKY